MTKFEYHPTVHLFQTERYQTHEERKAARKAKALEEAEAKKEADRNWQKSPLGRFAGVVTSPIRKIEQGLDSMGYYHQCGPYNLFKKVQDGNGSKRVGPYNLGEVVRKGDIRGQYVSMATERVSGRKVAIKVIPRRATQAGKWKTNSTEAIILRNHSHPNVMPFLDAMLSQNAHYIVTPPITFSLANLMTTTSNVFEKQIDILPQLFRGILSGLDYLHEDKQGVAHLNIKPESILIKTDALDANYNLKPNRKLDWKDFVLGGFDFARYEINHHHGDEDEHLSGAHSIRVGRGWMKGYPQYWAPELVRRQCLDGRRADLWSVGCLCLKFLPTTAGLKEVEGVIMQNWENMDRDAIALQQLNRRGYNTSLDKFLESVESYANQVNGPRSKTYLDLVLCFLKEDPYRRIPAAQSLENKFFEVGH